VLPSCLGIRRSQGGQRNKISSKLIRTHCCVSPVLQVDNSLTCAVCIDVVTDLDNWLTSDATEDAIVEFVEQVGTSSCHLI
jgi:hypothetical protein